MKFGNECFDESDFTSLETSNYTKTEQKIITWVLNLNCYDPTSYAVPEVPISNTSCDNVSYIDGLLPSRWTGHTCISYMREY